MGCWRGAGEDARVDKEVIINIPGRLEMRMDLIEQEVVLKGSDVAIQSGWLQGGASRLKVTANELNVFAHRLHRATLGIGRSYNEHEHEHDGDVQHHIARG